MKTGLLAILVVVVSAACTHFGGSAATSPSPSPSAPTLAKASGPLDAQVAMPQGFPSDIPIYPNARLTAGASFDSGGVISWGMEWETLDSVGKVHDFYATKLAQGDWSISFTASGSTAFSATFQRKSDSSAKGVIGADGSSGVTKISLYFASASSG